MSATPASFEMASLTALKSRSRAKTSVTSLMRSMNTNERILRNESCSACRTDRKKTLALVTEVETSQRTKISGRRGRTGLYLRTTGTPPVSSDARIVRRKSTCAWRLIPRLSWPCVFSRRLSWATTRCTAARSCSGPDGNARSSSFSGRAGGSDSVRSICARSSSRRRSASKRRIASRGRPSRRGSSSGRSGCGSARRPSERRMRWTSTPMTPEPSPWRPKAAIARRARARICPSRPSRSARAISWRSVSRLSSAPAASMPPPSVMPSRTAASSVARKKKRSKTRSKMRRSSWDFASVAASPSRKSSASVHGTSRSTSNASSSSLVPTATPSPRSSSPNWSRCAARPGGASSGGVAPYSAALRLAGGRGTDRQLHPDALGDDVEVGAVLDDDRQRLREHLLVDVVGAEQQQRARPVDRLGDRGRLLEIELADHRDDLDELARDGVVEVGRVELDDLELVLELRVVEPEIETAALERLGQLARVVRGQQHDRPRAGLEAAELGDRDLEVREQLEQHRLELLVGLVDLVDEQHDRLLGGDRAHQRALEQELLAEDVVLDLLPSRALGLGLDAQELLAVVPLVQRLGLVEALVALQAHEPAVEVVRQRARELGLPDAGGALDEDRLAALCGEERDERGRLAGEIADRAQAGVDVFDGLR